MKILLALMIALSAWSIPSVVAPYVASDCRYINAMVNRTGSPEQLPTGPYDQLVHLCLSKEG